MRQMFVDGAWVDALDGRTFETFDPATGAVLDTVPAFVAADVAFMFEYYGGWATKIPGDIPPVVRAGVVWSNDSQPAPSESMWGGFKQSGIGRELGPYALDAYLESKQIDINLA